MNVWALGFNRADVSNQSLSRGSLSLYPSLVELWVDGAGPVPLPWWCWVVVLRIQMVRHWREGRVRAVMMVVVGASCLTIKGLRAETVALT